jgi:hypothetical protein
VIGVRSVHGWTWERSLIAAALALAVPIAASVALAVG